MSVEDENVTTWMKQWFKDNETHLNPTSPIGSLVKMFTDAKNDVHGPRRLEMSMFHVFAIHEAIAYCQPWGSCSHETQSPYRFFVIIKQE